jgi:enamine deaminase RidA (YjgF/YER057c/UK114 family)
LYSQVTVAPAGARTVHVAGQVGISEDGPNGSEAQVDRAFGNMITAVEAAGGSVDDVVKITLLIADHGPDKLAYLVEKRRAVVGDAPPASLLIPVTRLYGDGVVLEIDATAVLTAGD